MAETKMTWEDYEDSLTHSDSGYQQFPLAHESLIPPIPRGRQAKLPKKAIYTPTYPALCPY